MIRIPGGSFVELLIQTVLIFPERLNLTEKERYQRACAEIENTPKVKSEGKNPPFCIETIHVDYESHT